MSYHNNLHISPIINLHSFNFPVGFLINNTCISNDMRETKKCVKVHSISNTQNVLLIILFDLIISRYLLLFSILYLLSCSLVGFCTIIFSSSIVRSCSSFYASFPFTNASQYHVSWSNILSVALISILPKVFS